MSCVECHEFWENKDKEPPCYKCQRHKTKPDILPVNCKVLDILNKYSSMIYNGECIFANGIELAMTLEEIPIPRRPLVTRKIIAYYNKVTENNNAKLKGSK